MNYIQTIQHENKVMRNGFNEIRRYLMSDKFAGMENHYVNPDDILHRIGEVIALASEPMRKVEVNYADE